MENELFKIYGEKNEIHANFRDENNILNFFFFKNIWAIFLFKRIKNYVSGAQFNF
jgi:hypothetical protein